MTNEDMVKAEKIDTAYNKLGDELVRLDGEKCEALKAVEKAYNSLCYSAREDFQKVLSEVIANP